MPTPTERESSQSLSIDRDYFNAGRPIADYLAATFDNLISSGLLALASRTDRRATGMCHAHGAGQIFGAVQYVQ